MPRKLVALSLCLAAHATAAPAVFGPRDMLQIVSFADGSQPVISPSGEWVAYATTDGSDEANILARHPTAFLWLTRTAGGEPRRILGEGDHAQIPVWSPDGAKLAFIRTRAGRAQLMVLDVASGTTRQLGASFSQDQSAWPSEGLAPHWTPDAGKLILAALEGAAQVAEKPRVSVIRGVDPVVPGDVFFVDKRAWKLQAVDVATGEEMAIAGNRTFALRSVSLSADGKAVRFRAVTPETLGHFRSEKTGNWTVPISGGDPQPAADDADRVLKDPLPKATRQIVISPQAKWLAALSARPGTGPKDRNMYSILQPVEDVLVVDLSTGKSRKLTSPDQDAELSDLVWSRDGGALFYRAVHPITFRETIYRWTPGDAPPTPIFSADRQIAHLSASADGHAVSFTATSAKEPPDAYVLQSANHEPRAITHLNPQLASFHFVAPEVFDYRSEDGEPLRALLYKPDGAGPNHRVPAVTYVYEKLSPMKNRFNPEAQMHVSNGYAYLMPDVLVNVGHTGDSFVKSVVPAVNAARAMNWLDGTFGITGGSFGGYAGLYLISHVNLFSAAVLRAPPSDFFSTWADGRDRDIWTIETGQARAGGSPWQNPLVYIENSPFFSADRVHTPLLIMHGEKDITVPTQQGEMMFYALRYLKRPVELVLYREGDHSIVRGSRDDYLDYYQRTLDWWQKYLPGHKEAQGQ